MSEERYIEELNMRAEQLAFIGRAMEREKVEMPLSEYRDEHPNSQRAEERMDKAQENYDALEEEYGSVSEFIDNLDYADTNEQPDAVTDILFGIY